MVSERTATWAMTATTADLLFSFYKAQDHLFTYRQVITTEGLGATRLDTYSMAIQAELDIIRVCVTELRARGHSVEWEE